MLTFPAPARPSRHDEQTALFEHARRPLLVTKLHPPPAPRDLVPRLSLTGLIEPDTSLQVTIISAPTGFGKTTLLREWSETTNRSFGWLSLDPGDNDADTFWSYMIAAIECCAPGFGAICRSLLYTPEAVTAEYVVTAIINELAELGDGITLILDDYHLITSEIVHRSMRFLIDHMPQQLHLVIAGRSDPPLGQPRLRALGRLVELDGADLSFQIDDANAYLIDQLGLSLTERDVASLHDRTEGWVAGLRLAAHALRQHPDPPAFIDGFSGHHRSIGDYLASDVLDQQPEPVQHFMVLTSILDHLSGPLCDAVTGGRDGQATLAALERANAFLIPLDGERHLYRYQGLFADVLRDRLVRLASDEIAAAHCRAARWYLEHGLTREAVTHALAGDDLVLVAEIIEQRACPMLSSGELETIAGWIAPLPREMVETRPILGCVFAWVLVLTGRVDEAEPLLEAVTRAIHTSGLTDHLGEVAAIRAYAARLRHQLPLAIELSLEARRLAPADAYSLRRAIALNHGIALWWCWQADDAERAFREAAELAEAGGEHAAAVVALCHRARIRCDQGFLDESWSLFQEASALSDRLGVSSLPSQSFLHLGMAYVLIERDQLDDAERSLNRAIELGTAGGKLDHVILAQIELTRIGIARGDLAASRSALRSAKSAIDRHPVYHLRPEVDLLRVLLWLAEGDLSAADAWAEDVMLACSDGPDWLDETERFALVHIRLAQGRHTDAAEILQSLDARSASTLPNNWRTCRIMTLTLQSRVQAAANQRKDAIRTLVEALQLAEPLGHIRTFADHGPPMADLLTSLPAAHGVSRSYIDRLIAACHPSSSPVATGSASIDGTTRLSQRELEVLSHIRDGLSNREIAETLYVTVGTVKRHTNSIYSKLSVSSRTQALARARTLNLLAG